MFNQVPQKIVKTNSLPFIMGMFALVIVLGVFLYKAQTNQKIRIVQSKPHQSLDISPKAIGSSWFNDEKFRNIKLIKNHVGQPTAQEIESQVNSNEIIDLKKQETEDEYSVQLEIKKMEDKDKIEDKKLELEASKSPLNVDVPPLPGAGVMAKSSSSSKNELTDELNEMTKMAKSATTTDKLSTLAGLGTQLITDLNGQGGKRDFLQKYPTDDDYLEVSKKKPHSPFEVKAGSYIPASLITGINSDLPGNVNAQITENVYDSITGNYLLIPQGSKLIGNYNSNLAYGQMRVQVVWNRIIFPDGESIDIENMQGVDISGYTGFHDKVNNHYFRIYGNAVLLSLMGAGYDVLNKNAEQSTDLRETVAASIGQKLANVSEQTLQKNMDVQPTLIIDPGYQFKVMVMKDMVLEDIKDVEGALSYTE